MPMVDYAQVVIGDMDVTEREDLTRCYCGAVPPCGCSEAARLQHLRELLHERARQGQRSQREEQQT